VAKDNNGFISRVSPDGHVLALKFIEGGKNGATLNAPKGMGIHGDTLFVADIDAIRMFSRTTGAALGSKTVPGATFLNDLDVGPDGAVYFSDSGLKPDFSSSGTDAVYRMDRTGLHKLAHGTDLARPNGVLADSAGVTVVAFGARRSTGSISRGIAPTCPTRRTASSTASSGSPTARCWSRAGRIPASSA